jgi:hypothetical protein
LRLAAFWFLPHKAPGGLLVPSPQSAWRLVGSFPTKHRAQAWWPAATLVRLLAHHPA